MQKKALSLEWAQAIVTDLFALLLVIGLYGLSLCRIKKKDTKIQKGAPVVLVHGYFNTGSVWAYIQRGLAKREIGPVFTVDLGNPFHSIEEHVETLATKISQIEKETGRKDIILIGHSMGGVVSALYATQKGSLGKVTDVITLGSPLSGTRVAKIGLGANARDMELNSPLCQEVQALIRSNQTIRFYHVASKTDILVMPYSSAWIDGPRHQKLIVSGIGHVSLVFSPRILRQIVEWIRNR